MKVTSARFVPNEVEGGGTDPEICMVGVHEWVGSDDVHMEKWRINSRSGGVKPPVLQQFEH